MSTELDGRSGSLETLWIHFLVYQKWQKYNTKKLLISCKVISFYNPYRTVSETNSFRLKEFPDYNIQKEKNTKASDDLCKMKHCAVRPLSIFTLIFLCVHQLDFNYMTPSKAVTTEIRLSWAYVWFPFLFFYSIYFIIFSRIWSYSTMYLWIYVVHYFNLHITWWTLRVRFSF